MRAGRFPSMTEQAELAAAGVARRRQVGGDHYMTAGVQPWSAMESWMTHEQFVGFLRGNAIKYLARADVKGGRQDIEKAHHYLEKLLEVTAEVAK